MLRRHTALQLVTAGKANNGIAAFDVVVEKVERLAGVVSFEPESHLTQFDCQGVQIHLRQDKLEIIEDEGILHEVKHFPCCLQEKYPCSCP